MQKTKDAFLRMIKAARKVKKVCDGLREIGLGDDTLFDAYGDIIDAIDLMVGAEFGPCEIETTVAYQAVNAVPMDNGLDMLMKEWEKHNMPRPHTFEPDEFYELLNKNGGFMYVPGIGAVMVTNGPTGELHPVFPEKTALTETPEGDWT